MDATARARSSAADTRSSAEPRRSGTENNHPTTPGIHETSPQPLQAAGEPIELEDRDVLDVGCGSGDHVRRLAAAGARVVGVDPQPEAVARARELDPGHAARYVEGAAEALPFDAASFDVVVFVNSLHHVPLASMDAALAEAARVLRPGGTLYVQEPLASGSFFELMRPVEDETGVRAAAQAALERAASEGVLEEVGRRDGVVPTRLEDFEAFHALMVRVDPARGPAVEAHAHALRDEFERVGRPRPDGGFEFDQPFRVVVLRAPG